MTIFFFNNIVNLKYKCREYVKCVHKSEPILLFMTDTIVRDLKCPITAYFSARGTCPMHALLFKKGQTFFASK